jgi:hypothetical protein
MDLLQYEDVNCQRSTLDQIVGFDQRDFTGNLRVLRPFSAIEFEAEGRQRFLRVRQQLLAQSGVEGEPVEQSFSAMAKAWIVRLPLPP